MGEGRGTVLFQKFTFSKDQGNNFELIVFSFTPLTGLLLIKSTCLLDAQAIVVTVDV